MKTDNPALKSTEITSELGRLWNELKNDASQASVLAKYERQALEDKQRYESQKSDIVDTKPKKEVAPKKEAVPKKESVPKKDVKQKVVKKKQDETVDDDEVQEEIVAPKKGDKDISKNVAKDTPNKKLNGYQKYSEVRRPELKLKYTTDKPADITKKLSDEWKVLSKEDKQKWTDA